MAELLIELVHSSHTEHRSCLIYGKTFLDLPEITYATQSSAVASPQNEEWSHSSELCSLPVIPRPWMLGAIPPNFCGQIILAPPIPLKQQLEAEGDTHLCGNQSQSLGKAESLIPQFYLLGANAAHRYIVVKRATDSLPPLITWGQGDLMTTFASNSSIVLRDGEIECGMTVFCPLQAWLEAPTKPDAPPSCSQTLAPC